MDDVLDTLTDLLGDPSRNIAYKRRGLIIGDVQSGKTANYTGLICKAVDSGYKVVVLLTGTIEKLRQQTQARIDEGFVGVDSDAIIKQREDIFLHHNLNLSAKFELNKYFYRHSSIFTCHFISKSMHIQNFFYNRKSQSMP